MINPLRQPRDADDHLLLNRKDLKRLAPRRGSPCQPPAPEDTARAEIVNVTVVTVTYGKRVNMLAQVLEAAYTQGASSAVVIDNGSQDPVARILAERFGGWARVHSLGANLGSAIGFKTGIAQALAQGAEHILLLDDDNVPAAHCLRNLAEQWLACKRAGERQDNFAVHAIRSGLNNGGMTEKLQMTEPRRGSFLGFHVAEIPYKLLRRLAPGLLRRSGATHSNVSDVSTAPYGGMFFHRDVIARIGLPNEAFFLYVDDYEFCARLTGQAGKIHIIRDAVINDIDTTWGCAEKHHYSALFSGRLESRNPSKLYYATRNMIYFELHVGSRKTPIYALNKFVFITILTIMALQTGNFAQFRTILIGMKDGREKCLGINQAYQL